MTRRRIAPRQNGAVRAFIDTLVAVKGTVTVALRRAHPRVLVGGGLVAVALLAGALYLVAIAPGGEDADGPGAGLGDSAAGSGAASGESGDTTAGDSLTDGPVQDASGAPGAAPRGSVAAAPAPVAPGAGPAADGGPAEPGESTPPAPAAAPTTGQSSTTTATGPSTTPGDTSTSSTTSTTAPTGTTAPGQGGLFGGLFDLLGLG